MPLKISYDLSQTSVRWSAADVRTIKKAVTAALEHQVGMLQNRFSVSITLTTDKKIQKINSEWRKKNQPTNVLSFPSDELENAAEYPEKLLLPLGDIILAYETCARESKAYGLPFTHHIMFLAVHGTLHLLGYDHQTDAEHQQMMRTEIAILASLGLANPYPFMQ